MAKKKIKTFDEKALTQVELEHLRGGVDRVVRPVEPPRPELHVAPVPEPKGRWHSEHFRDEGLSSHEPALSSSQGFIGRSPLLLDPEREAFLKMIPRPSLWEGASLKESWRVPAHDLSQAEAQITQSYIRENPMEAASDVAERAKSFIEDTTSWRNIFGGTSNKAEAAGVLFAIQKSAEQISSGLAIRVSEDQQKQIWQLFDRLQAFEKYHNKVPLSDAYLADFVLEHSDKIGFKANAEKLVQFGRNLGKRTTSKNSDASEAVKDAHEALRDRLVEARILALGQPHSDYFRTLVEKEPYAAFLYLKKQAASIRKQLIANADPMYDQFPEDAPAIRQLDALLSTDYDPKNAMAMKQALKNERLQILKIEEQHLLKPFDDAIKNRLHIREGAAIAAARGEDQDVLQSLVDSDPHKAINILRERATAAKARIQDKIGGGLFDLSVLAKLDSISNMMSPGESEGHAAVQARIVEKLAVLESIERSFGFVPTSQAVRLVLQGRSLDRMSLPSGPLLSWPEWFKGKITEEIPAYVDKNHIAPAIDGIRRKVENYVDNNQFADVVDAKKPKNSVIRWLSGPLFDGLKAAGQRGQFDAVLSEQGLNNVLAASNKLLFEMKNEVSRATDAEIPKRLAEHKENIKQAAQKVTDILLPKNQGAIQGIRRLFVKYMLEHYVLNGYAVRMNENLKKALGPSFDPSKFTPAQKAKADLAISRFFNAMATELGRNKEPEPGKGTDIPSQTADNLQRLVEQIDPKSLLGLPSSLGAVVSLAQPVASWAINDVRNRRVVDQSKILEKIQAFEKNAAGKYGLAELETLVSQHRYVEAEIALDTQIATLAPGRGLDKAVLQSLRADVLKMQSFDSALSGSFRSAYEQIVRDAIAPWLKGKPRPRRIDLK